MVVLSVAGVALCQQTAASAGNLAKWALITATIGLIAGTIVFVIFVALYAGV